MNEPIQAAEAFINDLLNLDTPAARDRLHPRVHLRALQPGATVGHTGATAVAADRVRQLACWDQIHILDHHAWKFAGRLGIDLRLHLHRGLDRWECEQRPYLDVVDGLIHRIDLLSSGSHPAFRPPDPTVHQQG
jgi:hypothetical protein